VIKVDQQPESPNFDTDVRKAGQKLFLNGYPISNKGYKNYWRHCARHLHQAYGGVCSYSCMYVIAPGSVDHFLPKVKYPQQAYEWANYRLSTQRVNQHKSDSEDIIDPFNVREGWFVLDFPSCLVQAGNEITAVIAEQVNITIRVLKLNDDDSLVQERCDIMLEYAKGNVTLNFLQRRYPFLALEISRQGIEDTAVNVFRLRNTG
jgi:hypothetical protein